MVENFKKRSNADTDKKCADQIGRHRGYTPSRSRLVVITLVRHVVTENICLETDLKNRVEELTNRPYQ